MGIDFTPWSRLLWKYIPGHPVIYYHRIPDILVLVKSQLLINLIQSSLIGCPGLQKFDLKQHFLGPRETQADFYLKNKWFISNIFIGECY